MSQSARWGSLKIGVRPRDRDPAQGNELARKGTLGPTVKSILEQIKPEAAYFPAEGGHRSSFLVVNLTDASEMPAIAEPWFQALNATVEIQPVMLPEDMEKAEAAITRAATTY